MHTPPHHTLSRLDRMPPAAAEAALREWIARHGRLPEACARLGSVLLALRRPREALAWLEQAEQAWPQDAHLLCLIASAWQDLDRPAAARDKYREAVAAAPELVQAWNNLGLVLAELGELDHAVDAFQAALARQPAYATAHNNLGSVLLRQGRYTDAVAAFRRAVEHEPGLAEAWLNLGLAGERLNRIEDATAALRAVLRLRPGTPAALLALARCHMKTGEPRQATALLDDAARAGCADRELLLELGRLLAAANRAADARRRYASLLAVRPGDLRAALGAHLTLPVVYGSSGDIDRERERYTQGLQAVERIPAQLGGLPDGVLLEQLAWSNFLLAYQGRDDRALQQRYGAWLVDMLQGRVPAPAATVAAPPRAGRPRIGFASTLLGRGTVGAYFSRWATGLDRRRFEVFVYDGAEGRADDGNALAGCEHYIRLPLAGRNAALRFAQRIAADRLDVLIYPELGMSAPLFPLAALRLARVQCAAWGHPVTTGLPTIDCFFSCDAMEPERAQAQYSERLIRLPGIGTCYPRPRLPAPVPRDAFGLPAGRRLYLFPHSPFKIHPDNDALLAAIAARDPLAVFVLASGSHPQPGEDLLQRMADALTARGVEPAGRFVMLPYLRHDDYLRVNLLCDVLLDTLHWSGGNTTLDALACGLPVVTLPGETMRSRQSAAILRMVGAEQAVAADPGDYVRIAVRVAGERAWRDRIANAMASGAGRLFDDETSLRRLEIELERLAGIPEKSG